MLPKILASLVTGLAVLANDMPGQMEREGCSAWGV